MKIILDGTSSAGKSSIVKVFSNNYTKIALDDLENNKEHFNKKIKNRYYTENEADEIFFDIMNKRLSERAKNKKNFIIDIVNPRGYPTIQKYLPKDTIKILIYTDLQDLVRNMNSRRFTEARGKYVFRQFSSYYIKTTNKDNAIDQIKLSDFIKALKNIKYEFESEKDLKSFAKDIFKSMNINDNKVNYITSRYEGFDIIIKTKNKKPKDLKDMILDSQKYLLS